MGILLPSNLNAPLLSFLSLFLLLQLCDATEIAETRQLEGQRNYRATYQARYQHLLDRDHCSAGPDGATIEIFCRGGLSPNSVSDASIACTRTQDAAGWKGLSCTHPPCDGQQGACDSSFVGNNETTNFGEIVVTCVGETEADVDVYMTYLGGPPGTCAATTTTTDPPQNTHVAQLGVQCPSESAAAVFQFDDHHFECDANSVPSKLDDRYTCSAAVQNRNCGDDSDECTVEYANVTIHADREQFHECITPIWLSKPVGPEPGPVIAMSPPGHYTATFQAQWQLSLDTDYCSGQFAPKQIHCLHGTTLENVTPLHGTVDCQMLNASSMECRDTEPDNFVNNYSGVIYECQGDTLPLTQAVYGAALSYCNTTNDMGEPAKQVAHSLQLGVQCRDDNNDTVLSHADAYFECGPDNEYEFSSDGAIYTCQSVNSFAPQPQQPADNTPPVHKSLPQVVMETGVQWTLERPTNCFQFVPALPDDIGASGIGVVQVEQAVPGLGIPLDGSAGLGPSVAPAAMSGGTLGIPIGGGSPTPVTAAPSATSGGTLGIPIAGSPTPATAAPSATGGGTLGIPIGGGSPTPATAAPSATGGGTLGIPIAGSPTPATAAPSAMSGGSLGIPIAPPPQPSAAPAKGGTLGIPVDTPGVGGTPIIVEDLETIIPSTLDPSMEELSFAPFTNPPGTIYKASYVGRFQQVLSEGCENVAPSMILTCTGAIVNVTTSDPSIDCTPESSALHDDRNAVLCVNECDGEACESVYLASNTVGEDPFGEIYFECQGETLEEVDGSFIVTESQFGVCDGKDPEELGYNLNIIQLGVDCPTGASGRSYVVDDLHAECGLYNQALNFNGAYSCISGLACGANQCFVPFDNQLIILADPHRFQKCVTTNNGLTVPEIAAPDLPARPAGTYTAQFKAVWFFDLPVRCEGSEDTKQITCTNGIIRLLESHSIMQDNPCRVIGDDTIECRDPGLAGDVAYECESESEIPETMVEYVSGTTSCDSASTIVVERALRLGVDCGGGVNEAYVYGDVFLECGAGNSFEVGGGSNFTCFGSVSVPASDSSRYAIPEVEIATDFRWGQLAHNNCFRYQPSTRNRQLTTLENRDVSKNDLEKLIQRHASRRTKRDAQIPVKDVPQALRGTFVNSVEG